MVDKTQINEAMQPELARDKRDWQRISAGAFAYGECPVCGASGQCTEEGYSLIDESETETWHCLECGCEWELDVDTAYRFGRVLPQD